MSERVEPSPGVTEGDQPVEIEVKPKTGKGSRGKYSAPRNPGGRTKGTVEKKPRKGRAASRARQAKMLTLAATGMGATDIARTLEVHPNTVRAVLKYFQPVLQNLENVDQFRSVRADILDSAQMETLKSMMSPTKLRKASFNNLAYGARQLYDMSRLERGQSTSNQTVVRFARAPISDLPSEPAVIIEPEPS